MILGAGGRLGAALARVYAPEFQVTAFDRQGLNLSDPAQLRQTLGGMEFDVLINSAAQTNVDRCEIEQGEAFAINGEAPGELGEICTGKRARLIHISTDYVFDGAKTEPYTEEDEARPISVYGASKLKGEQRVLAAGADHLVVRVSWVFGPDRPSFVDAMIQRAQQEDRVQAVADKYSTPSYTLDLAGMLRPFLDGDFPGGILHLANRGQCSWREYAQWAVDCCARAGWPLRTRTIEPLALADMKNFVARRPIHTTMASNKYEQFTGHTPRDWREAVADYVQSIGQR